MRLERGGAIRRPLLWSSSESELITSATAGPGASHRPPNARLTASEAQGWRSSRGNGFAGSLARPSPGKLRPRRAQSSGELGVSAILRVQRRGTARYIADTADRGHSVRGTRRAVNARVEGHRKASPAGRCPPNCSMCSDRTVTTSTIITKHACQASQLEACSAATAASSSRDR